MKCDVGLMIDRDVAEKRITTRYGCLKHTRSTNAATTPTAHTHLSHPLAAIFNLILFLFFFYCKRNVRWKIVPTGCNKCVWEVGVVAACGDCVFKTSLPCCHSFFSYIHHDQSSTLHRISFFCQNVFLSLLLFFFVNKVIFA